MDFIYLYQLAKPSLCTAPVALKPAEVLQPATETRLSHTHLLPGTVSTDYVSKFELNNPRRTNEVRPESEHCFTVLLVHAAPYNKVLASCPW